MSDIISDGVIEGQPAPIDEEVTPPDICLTVPLIVIVTAWPKNRGKGQRSGSWSSSETLNSAQFLWNPQRFEAVDERGCKVAVIR